MRTYIRHRGHVRGVAHGGAELEALWLVEQPILSLTWNDVKQQHFTWRQLRALGLEAAQLKRLQPDKHEWLQRGVSRSRTCWT
jgi:hypothetical protein